MYRLIFPLICIVTLCTFFSACEDPETPDTDGPEITIVSPKEDQRVARNVTIEATAEDIDPEIAMQIFLDGNLIQESQTDVISVDSDTRLLTDGVHEIKITAVDGSDN